VEACLSDLGTLSEQLAERLVQKLVQAGFLRHERQQAVAMQIANGKMKAETWKLDIELALDKSKRS
jgi:hypothetical protein